MNVENARSNYTEDRSSSFKHHVPLDIAPPGALTAHDYMANERTKQLNKMRDWYLESKNQNLGTDAVSLRKGFTCARNFSAPSPIQELEHHKWFLIAGVVLATAISSAMLFIHF